MKLRLVVPLLLFIIFLPACSSVKSLVKPPSALESALALKEILNSSAFKTISALASEGSIDNIIPSEINSVLTALNTLGYGQEINQVKSGISLASKVVATESQQIMKEAIKEVSFTDAALVVVTGGDAATTVLKNAMYTSVTKRYSERLDTELAKTEAPKYWPIASGAYNIFAQNKIDDSLSDFLAKRAVDAIFLGMGAREKEVRQDYKSLGKKVVTKVFDYYKDKKVDNKGNIVKK